MPMRRALDLSFCMIVRDGAPTLGDCLRSVAHLADEMIVVDTGSTDESRDIARAFGATVVDERWRDDFAAARNEYLKRARGRWILVLDADEEVGPLGRSSLLAYLAAHDRTAFALTSRNYFRTGQRPDWAGYAGY